MTLINKEKLIREVCSSGWIDEKATNRYDRGVSMGAEIVLKHIERQPEVQLPNIWHKNSDPPEYGKRVVVQVSGTVNGKPFYHVHTFGMYSDTVGWDIEIRPQPEMFYVEGWHYDADGVFEEELDFGKEGIGNSEVYLYRKKLDQFVG